MLVNRARAPATGSIVRQRPALSRSSRLRVRAAQPDGKGNAAGGKGDDKADPRKADFSAYWSLKIRELFSSRRKYLEEVSKKNMPEPEFLKKMQKQIDVEQAEVDKLGEEQQLLQRIKYLNDQDLEKEAIEEARKIAKPLEDVLFSGKGAPQRQAADSGALALASGRADILDARAALRPSVVSGVGMTLYRTQHLLRTLLLLPFTLARNLGEAWSKTFTSQRYENFLMAEGERIWYWRNRTENERWFWEIFFWDRLLFPILVTVAYEALVPNNFFWAVILPFALVVMQTGRLLGPANMEFWLIAYFGFYRKCWPDFLALLSMLFQW
mmetsp:Transcript_16526/g.35749  ORF Transcript_16526/g.35749 Transcript_16526/m.35749 type:complete len:326 (+) Transcript_16526:103-1080(+)|eukprot:CAMPEP_0202902314 /NCGR_PEP_ID=MMETSP1392-20130828/16784_1 /ASSEMBLY_ACC=CAM_ASM_000868 /TAXON_ID=225041 /ORGANISM="Chlamydomonas chlamydogama, Strain SAG 11-48b" /LENGTH=325 /DNA_ID=CAMNT_0049589063 /DNA_START=103 /DNA_END=1080 /DNA_ORIENTATION=-